MKTKTINLTIRNKFEELLKTVKDEKVREMMRCNTIITGGCIASMLLREPVNDFDMYFRNKETAKAVADYYVGVYLGSETNKAAGEITVDELEDRIRIKIRSVGIASSSEDIPDGPAYQYFEADSDPDAMNAAEYAEYINTIGNEFAKRKAGSYLPVFLSSNAITLSDQVQIIIRFFGDPEEIHKNFDYVHATNYWTSWDEKVVLRPEALECLLTKELRYIGSRYPICSLFRLRKFLKRGFTINAGQILKICLQIQQLDLTNPAVLEEQLIGVDYAYFREIIAKVQRASETGGTVDNAYLFELLDQVF